MVYHKMSNNELIAEASSSSNFLTCEIAFRLRGALDREHALTVVSRNMEDSTGLVVVDETVLEAVNAVVAVYDRAKYENPELKTKFNSFGKLEDNKLMISIPLLIELRESLKR